MSLAATQTTHAQNNQEQFKINTDTTVTVNEKASMLDMEHKVTVKNQTSESLRTLDYALGVSSAEDISVQYSRGKDIPFTTAEKNSQVANRDFAHKGLILDFPKDIKGKGKSWSFTISYTTEERVHAVGGNATLTMPLLDGGVADSWQATVKVPDSLANVNYGPKFKRVTKSGGQWSFGIDGKTAGGNFLGLSFARNQTHTAKLNTRIRNLSLLPKTVYVNLPMDTHSQSSFTDSIDPEPDEVSVDADGNIIAQYRLLPLQRVYVTATSKVRVEQLRYDPSGVKKDSEAPEQLSGYLESGKYWNLDGTAKESSDKAVDSSDDAWSKTRKLHDFVKNEIAMDRESSKRVPAEKVLEERSGGALNRADLLVAMLRGQEIPARLIKGYVYPSSGLYEKIQSHSWVEAYVPGMGWTTLDPAHSELFNSFGYSSFDRVATQVISNDKQYKKFRDMSSTTVELEPGGELPEKKKTTERIQASATRYIVFPGLVYDKRHLDNNSGYVIDEVSASGLFNGSLAPNASISRGQWNFAGFKGFDMRVQAGEEDPVTVAGQTSWWPLFITVFILAIAAVVQFYRYRIKSYVRARLHGKILH